jgi:Mg2+ and Co2+ transporter CorA
MLEYEKKVDVIVTQVKKDYEYLRREPISLAAECASSISLEMNRIIMDDAKESIRQAERVRRLTFLAYLFLPLSFVVSLFGMNVTQLTSPNPSIWLYFTIACPVTLVCALVPVWHDVLGFILEQ